MNQLDPRDARQLTSREASKVLGGLIGSFGSVYPKEFRKAFEVIASALKDRQQIDPSLFTGLDGEAMVIVVGLAGMCGALEECAGPEAMRTAVLWWYEHVDQVLSVGGVLTVALAPPTQEQPS